MVKIKFGESDQPDIGPSRVLCIGERTQKTEWQIGRDAKFHQVACGGDISSFWVGWADLTMVYRFRRSGYVSRSTGVSPDRKGRSSELLPLFLLFLVPYWSSSSIDQRLTHYYVYSHLNSCQSPHISYQLLTSERSKQSINIIWSLRHQDAVQLRDA